MRWVSDRSTGPSRCWGPPLPSCDASSNYSTSWRAAASQSFSAAFFRGLSGWNMDNFPNTLTSNMNRKIRYLVWSPDRFENPYQDAKSTLQANAVHGSFTLRRYRVWITREIYCTEIGDVDAHAKPPEAWLVHKRTRKNKNPAGRQAGPRSRRRQRDSGARASTRELGGWREAEHRVRVT